MDNSNSRGGGNGGRWLKGKGKSNEKSDEDTRLKNLPSESDRKTTLGCLAAVLNIMFAARQRKYDVDKPVARPEDVVDSSSQPATQNNAQDDGASEECGAQNIDNDNEAIIAGAADGVATFSIRDEEQNQDAPSKSKIERQQQKAMRRIKAFQRELLSVSAELLFLTPDNAAVFMPNLDIQCVDHAMEQEMLLQPFLQSLSSSEASFQCVALLLFRFLLVSGEEKPKDANNNEERGKKKVDSTNSSSSTTQSSVLKEMTIVGYDSRVRFAFKYLAVSILSYWEMKEHDFMTKQSAAAHATRKFEALEDGIADRLAALSEMLMQEKNNKTALAGQKKESSVGQNAIRGLKIGGAAVAAGTLFAITGGLAAPAIVGGIAAIAGASSAVTLIATVLLIPAATTIFGVGGGTLVASKMSKRTAGLTEFEIVKITTDSYGPGDKKRNKKSSSPELSRTVCIGGWLRDTHDDLRPFGSTPSDLSSVEVLCRYCSVYAPHIIPECENILKEWKGKESELWDMLKSSYGKDPRCLLPFEAGPRYDATLSTIENKSVDDMVRAMGLPLPATTNDTNQNTTLKSQEEVDLPPTVNLLSDVLVSKSDGDKPKKQMTEAMFRFYKAWDFHAEYGSEQYVIRWERELLLDITQSAKEFQRDLAKTATKEVLKKTAMASLMTAVFLPSALLSLSNIIDAKWTLVSERSDEAGVLLAQSLLNSNAGHRPVSLVGFSFGARMIIACLKELSRNQAIWEQQQGGEEDGTQTQSMTASLKKSISSMSSKQNQTQVKFNREPASVIEDVILMGTPASVNVSTMASCRQVVGGRLVNCYTRNDMLLAFLYRVNNIAQILSPPIGISAVGVPGVESYDVSRFVASHGEYCVAVQDILNHVGYAQPVNLNLTVAVDKEK